ncbi:sensor histidine kinase [Flavimaricola marinus]|uniref:histidine kinase n=1 Tax=Flavimaricola marinus TaxID=1819565 RepID=A0A238LCU7_9RHOB|nr:ATP-binding protein [Flavimaricola marinus]SMY07412.1 Alkaline phosphatase synthesis sensor protein PhoR [Flavimaricola marinus]
MLPSTLPSLIAVLPMPVVLVGANQRVEAVNTAAIRLFGTDGTGRNYITALRQPALLEAVEQTYADKQTRTAQYYGREGARDTTWTVTVGPVPMQLGLGVVLSFEDMTAMEETGQIRRDFVANVSHELRTPLTALLGFVETLKGAARDDAKARDRFLGIMEREAGRMARLVDDLLSLSRVEQDERVRPRELVDLSAVLLQVINVLAPVAAQSEIEVDFVGPESPVQVPGDAAQLQQVATNLIENAIKYGGHGGRVEVRLTEIGHEPALRGPAVQLSVTDEGDGIEPHHIPRLTERFYRVDSHRSRELGGTGLGLAIVKHIVNRHRGRLRVDSTLGEGSTFRILLPSN